MPIPANIKGEQMRGLSVFIADIRGCKSREAEKKRINKELANIRSKFKGDKQLDGYQKKKYVCKLLFIFLLGNDIDFGHMEAVNLLSSIRYSEKHIGYLFITVLLTHTNDLMKLICQNIRNDLLSCKPLHMSMAMQCLATIAGPEMADTFHEEILRILTASDMEDCAIQNACLCLVRMLRQKPGIVKHSEWASQIIKLISHSNLGIATAACSLVQQLASENPAAYSEVVGPAAERLKKLVSSNGTNTDYTYYFVSAPWLKVALLRLLQLFPPPKGSSVQEVLKQGLESILHTAQEAPKCKKVQYSNAKNAVLFEGINLIIHMDCDSQLMVRAANHLGHFLTHRETNLRYLALEALSRLAASELCHDAVNKHQDTVITALKKERDVSVRQRAADLLYTMCDRKNAEKIVAEMLKYLETANYSIREEMVLKVAIISEMFAVDYTWYVDTILNLIRIAGDYVSEEVWFRVIQVVINRDDVQGYATKTVFEALQRAACHENMVKVGGYILGEFGNLIAGDERSSPMVQFQLLHSKFPFCSSSTRGLLLSAYVKLINLFPEMKPHIQNVLKSDSNIRSSDVEIQQRAVEYFRLSDIASTDVLATVLEEMPPFPERESSLLAKLKKKKGEMSIRAPRSSRQASEGSRMPNSKQPEQLTAATTTAAVPLMEQAKTSAAQAPTSLISIGDDLSLASNGPYAAGQPSTNAFGDLFGSSDTAVMTEQAASAGPGPLVPGADEALETFVCASSGVLFENDLIQIGVKSEYRSHLGQMGLFFGNKAQMPLRNFTSTVHCLGDLQQQVTITTPAMSNVIEVGAQQQQLINIECVSEFLDTPLVDLRFAAGSKHCQLTLKLPLFVSKFFDATTMNSGEFFQRWQALNNPDQEKQEIFKAHNPIDRETSKEKLLGFGLSVMEGIDPNVENFVSAGIIQTKGVKVGVLLRLEPNAATEMYRLTVRASKPSVARRICQLLLPQF